MATPQFGNAIRNAMICPYCAQVAITELLEVFDDGTFQIDTCCPMMLDGIATWAQENGSEAAKWLASLTDKDGDTFIDLVPHRPRQIFDADGQLLVSYRMKIGHISWNRAKTFIARHHRHCNPPIGWRFGAGAYNGSQLVGVVTVGRPIARGFDPRLAVEVNRLCVRADLPGELVRNAASMLYGWAAREARKRGFFQILTYTLESERGITLHAAGWQIDGLVRGRSWNCSSRRRRHELKPENKVRWVRNFDSRNSTHSRNTANTS